MGEVGKGVGARVRWGLGCEVRAEEGRVEGGSSKEGLARMGGGSSEVGRVRVEGKRLGEWRVRVEGETLEEGRVWVGYGYGSLEESGEECEGGEWRLGGGEGVGWGWELGGVRRGG